MVLVEAGETDPRRRRGDRRHRLRGRVGDHRRVGAGHPRERRRPQSPSPAARGCSPTGSRCASPPTRARRFLDRMIALVEGAERQKTPNEIALNILLAGLTIIFLLVVVTLQPLRRLRSGAAVSVTVLIALLVCLIPTTIGGAALGHRHRRHGPPGAAQRARDVRPRRRGGRRRRHAAAGQDRHHHARQPAGRRVHPRAGRHGSGARRRGAARLARRRDAGGPLDRGARQGGIGLRGRDIDPDDAMFVAVHRADAHERHRPRRPLGPQGRRPTRS